MIFIPESPFVRNSLIWVDSKRRVKELILSAELILNFSSEVLFESAFILFSIFYTKESFGIPYRMALKDDTLADVSLFDEQQYKAPSTVSLSSLFFFLFPFFCNFPIPIFFFAIFPSYVSSLW